MAQFSLLRIPVTISEFAAWSAETDLFDTDNGHFLLYVQPPQYKPIVTELGDGNSILVGFNAVTVAVSNKLFGFEITTEEGRMAPYEILRKLELAASANPGSYSAITVYDGLDVYDSANAVTFGGNKFMQRSMRIESLQKQGGALVNGTTNYSIGFTLRMVDLIPRRI